MAQSGTTSLHLACYAGHRGAAEWLASHAEFAECDAHGWTFAHAACTGGHPQVLEFLDSQGHAEFEAAEKVNKLVLICPSGLHGEEHLATTDRGIVMLRRLLARQIEAVERGEDPVGVHFDEASAYVRLEAGQYVEPAEPAKN